jgi:hypothetical protein
MSEYKVEYYDKLLQSLTPGGSEFVNDPERCLAYIKRELFAGSEARKDRVRLKRINNDLTEALRLALVDIKTAEHATGGSSRSRKYIESALKKAEGIS